MDATRYWLPKGLGVLSFLWFAVISAPGFYWLDSAELSASGLALGSPHPSGFPLYMLLIKLASFVPVGELAFRVNLLSAVCASLAVGGVARLILVLGSHDEATIAGAVAGAGVLCFSVLFVRHATIAQVHAPTAALVVLTLLLFERVAAGGSASSGLSLAWVAGLGFALHPHYRLLLGLPIMALLAVRSFRGARWPLVAPAFAVFSALAMHLYLPIRSATGRLTSLDWGHPNTLGRTWSHASSSNLDTPVGTLESHDVPALVGQILDHMGVLAVLAGLVGLLVLLNERHTRWPGVALIWVVFLDLIYSSGLHPVGIADLQNGIPLVLALSVSAGVAVATLAKTAGRAAPILGGAVALIMLLPPILFALVALPPGGDLPREAGETALRSTPSGAILSDKPSLSSVIYLQFVEGTRPDVVQSW